MLWASVEECVACMSHVSGLAGGVAKQQSMSVKMYVYVCVCGCFSKHMDEGGMTICFAHEKINKIQFPVHSVSVHVIIFLRHWHLNENNFRSRVLSYCSARYPRKLHQFIR